MAAPTFRAESETSWTTTATKTTSSFNVTASDLLVAFAHSQDWGGSTASGSLGISGGGLTWVAAKTVKATAYCQSAWWTATASANTAMTAQITCPGSTVIFGANVLIFGDSAGVGTSISGTASGAAATSITTTQANSALVVSWGDWDAVQGSARVWLTAANASAEQTYNRSVGNYTVYGAYYSDMAAAAGYTVGCSAPTGQKYAIGVVEVLGISATAAGVVPKNLAALGVG